MADEEMKRRALEWSKRRDGGRLCVWWPAGSNPDDTNDGSQPIIRGSGHVNAS